MKAKDLIIPLQEQLRHETTLKESAIRVRKAKSIDERSICKGGVNA